MRRLITDLRCEAVFRCTSRNIELICVRSALSGVSSGTSYAAEDLDVVDVLEVGVCVDAFRDVAVAEDREALVEGDTRLGIALVLC